MTYMVRIQIDLEPEQDAALVRRACELGVTQSQLVRDAIDLLLAQSSSSSAASRAWDETVRFMRGEGRAYAGSGGRRRSREALHAR